MVVSERVGNDVEVGIVETVEAGINVCVGEGVIGGLNNRPSPQLEMNKLITAILPNARIV